MNEFNIGFLAASLAVRMEASDQYDEGEMADIAAHVAVSLLGSDAPEDLKDLVIEQYGDRGFINLLAEEVDKIVAIDREEFDGGAYNAPHGWIREQLAHVIG